MSDTDKSELDELMNELEDAVWCSRGDVSTQNAAAAQRAVEAKKAIKALITQQCNQAEVKGNIDGGMSELSHFINDAMYTGRKTVEVSRLIKAYDDLSEIAQAKETEGES